MCEAARIIEDLSRLSCVRGYHTYIKMCGALAIGEWIFLMFVVRFNLVDLRDYEIFLQRNFPDLWYIDTERNRKS